MSAARIVDLSHPIDDGVPMFPGHPQPAVEEFLSRKASERNYVPGTSFVIHRYSFLGNTGTYLDSPFHRFADGDDLGTLDLAKTVNLPGVVLDARERVEQGNHAVGVAEIADLDVRGKAVLIATGWDSRWPSPEYLERKPYLTGDGAEVLRDRGAILVGLDTWNIDDVADRGRPAHSVLLRAGITIVENLRGLELLPSSGFLFFAAPLPFRDGSAIPVRAFALVDSVDSPLPIESQFSAVSPRRSEA
jgi:kynurenine formamidase